MSRFLWRQLGLALGLAQVAYADPPDPGQELKLIESTEANEDPLGLDDSTGRGLEQAAARLPKPRASLPSPNQGEGLSAIAGVRESAHALSVELDQGLAFVRARITLASRATHAAEIAYRLPLPEDGVVTRVRVCMAARAQDVEAQPAARAQVESRPAARGQSDSETCRDANPEQAGTRGARPEQPSARDANPEQAGARGANPEQAGARGARPEQPSARGGSPERGALWAGPIADARGRALALRVSPLAPGATLAIEVEYVAEAAIRGGRARFHLPARGYDPNLAPTSLSVTARGLGEIAPGSELSLDPWLPLELTASLPKAPARTQRETRATCGAQPCLRRFEASAPRPPEMRPTWLWIDASPSMEGPARGRAGAALAALLELLPGANELRSFAFAARAVELGRGRADQAALAPLADATLLELGASTHPARALALARAELARTRPRIVVISDGAFDATADERAALFAARRLGAELWLVALGPGEPTLRDSFTGVLRVAALAERAMIRAELAPLEEALSALVSPKDAHGVAAGEQRVLERAPRDAWPLRAGAPWLTFWLARARPAPRWQLAATPAPDAAIAAIPYLDAPPPAVSNATGMPKESVLSMLRTQLVPEARACLRSDRKGRGDYAVELTFHALFAQREVFDARIEGAIPHALRGCLEGALANLRVPAFTGRIRVHYPIHTEREAPPPVIELEPEVAAQLERAFGAERALP